MSPRPGSESDGVWRQEVHAPTEARWEDIFWGFLADLPGDYCCLTVRLFLTNRWYPSRPFRNSVLVTLPTTSSKGCVISTRTHRDLFQVPNCVIYWQLSAKSWAMRKLSSCWTTRRTRKATWTTRSLFDWSWMASLSFCIFLIRHRHVFQLKFSTIDVTKKIGRSCLRESQTVTLKYSFKLIFRIFLFSLFAVE